MFKINGSKNYKVLYVKGGKGQKNEYTFLTVEGEASKGQKYPERLKINLWGENLEGKVTKDSFIKILGANSVGIVSSQDKNDPNKWYQNLTIECGAGDIQVVENETGTNKSAMPDNTQPIDDAEKLPF